VLAHILEPQLQYGAAERDVAIARVEARGLHDGQPRQVVCEVVDRRDLDTGLFAMNRLVGFTASIAAQLVATGQVEPTGVLSPATDLPAERFAAELEHRGIAVRREIRP
jgi:saccharopine dehydrogenase-like NADP-dependent oxidoreductase